MAGLLSKAPGGVTAREAALRALAMYRRGNSLPDEALERYTAEMPARESALAMKLLSGVLQNKALCDYYISCYSKMKLNRIEPQVLDILRISVYQIVFLTRIPRSAAVNEGVSLCAKHADRRSSGYVNAVLRKVSQAAETNALPQITGLNAEEILSVRYSHPEWLVRELCDELGSDEAELFLEANNADDVPVCAQVNTLLTNTEDVLRELGACGAEVSRHDWLPDCVLLKGAGDITRLEAFRNGHIYIQDAAARLAVTAAAPKPGMLVIDGCAAPGGKSFASAIAMENKGRIVAADVTDDKLLRIKQSAERLGIKIIDTVINDATAVRGDITDIIPHKADIVIADVPCSGFGVIRKKPDIRYKSAQMTEYLPAVQREILKGLSAYVRPGGVLLYSTCTVLKRENGDVIDWFLSENADYRLESFSLPHIGDITTGFCTLMPHIHGTDGFFICKLRRRT